MTAAAQQVASLPAAQVPNGVCFISGRIERSTPKTGQHGRYFVTLVKMPAPDQFSSPATIEVSSESQLGARGDEVRLKVRVFGYPRSFQTKPSREFPEGETVYTADNRLEVIG